MANARHPAIKCSIGCKYGIAGEYYPLIDGSFVIISCILCMVACRDCPRKGLRILAQCSIDNEDICQHDDWTFPNNIVEPEDDPHFVRGLQYRTVSTNLREDKKKVWGDIAHVGNVDDWWAIVSLALTGKDIKTDGQVASETTPREVQP